MLNPTPPYRHFSLKNKELHFLVDTGALSVHPSKKTMHTVGASGNPSEEGLGLRLNGIFPCLMSCYYAWHLNDQHVERQLREQSLSSLLHGEWEVSDYLHCTAAVHS